VYDKENNLVNIQFIHTDGSKPCIMGGPLKDCHYWIVKPSEVKSKTIIICEGWATGKSTHDATGYSVIMVFGKGNLLSVAEWVRKKNPDYTIIVAADDDGGKGVELAEQAARAVDGLVAKPEFGKGRKKADKDFNDLSARVGLDEVKRQIDNAGKPESDEQPEGDSKKDKKQKETQALTLFRLAPSEPQGGLFRTVDGVGYADIVVDDHRQTWRIGSKKFERWLRLRFYEEKNQTPTAEAVKQAVEMIETRAQFDKDIPVREVFVRVGGLKDRIFIDLCDEKWRVVEVTATGWWINKNPPIRFRRVNGMLPLPEPQQGGKLEDLRPFVNVKADDKDKQPRITDSDFVLAVSWLLAAFRERGPYPILKIWGEPGAAKSTLTEALRSLVDPHKVTRRRLPREDRDLFIAANNAWVLSYDNVSQIQEWLSNSLCAIATGGGFATRSLHTDQDEMLFDAMRPVIINGVENFITKHDFADRNILLELPFIAKGRRTEADFRSAFEAQRPGILGALLDVVVHGLKMLPTVEQEQWPRMADFAHWITACETALWDAGTFRKAYAANRKKGILSAIDDDPIATALRGFINDYPADWKGTTTELLQALTKWVGEKQSNSKDWPQSARALTGHLQKAKGALRAVGIKIRQGGRTNKGRVLTISHNPAPVKVRKDRHDTHDRHFDNDHNKIQRDGRRDGRHDSNADAHATDTRSTRRNSLKSNEK
jgi:Toprim domain